jgi:hypothetical protein
MNRSSIHEEIKKKLISESTCHNSVKNIYLSKNAKIGIDTNYNLPVLLYGSETLSLTKTEIQRLQEIKNRVMMKINRHRN